MNCSLLSKAAIAAAVEKSPAVGEVLKKLASKAVRGVRLPDTFSGRGLDYEAQREFEYIFGSVGQRKADGRLQLPILEPLREPAMWRGAIEYFGLAEKACDSGDNADVFARLKLLEPKFDWALDILAKNEAVKKFVSRLENRKRWMRLFRGAVARFMNEHDRSLTTLSQLGSDWFGDSKILRIGALRHQLVLIISALGDNASEKDEWRILEEFGIIDNPYTSNVTVFAPIVVTLGSGVKLDFPLRLFENGMAASLPLETVRLVKSLEWRGKRCDLTTCENAAPFTKLIGRRTPSLYTAGYPSLAAKLLLSLMSSDGGLQCIHHGDADLDGFRIAEEVGNCIKLKLVAASAIQKCANANDGIPLADEQARRALAYLTEHPDFRFADDVRRMLSRGRWIEQESFDALRAESKKGAET